MIRTLATSLLVVAVLSTPTSARADEQSGLALGLRAAYALPFGDAGGGAKLNQLTAGAIPLQLDVGYRFDRRWQVGGYFGWGPARIADDARSGLSAQGATDISGHAIMRIGVQGSYSFLPDARLAPWVGLSAGWEWVRYASATVAGAETEIGVRGFEAGVQVGGDYRIAPRFTIGPFASFHVGQFRSTMTWRSGSSESTADISDKKLHEWLQLGLKGTFNL